jgi:hypothetical protein
MIEEITEESTVEETEGRLLERLTNKQKFGALGGVMLILFAGLLILDNDDEGYTLYMVYSFACAEPGSDGDCSWLDVEIDYPDGDVITDFSQDVLLDDEGWYVKKVSFCCFEDEEEFWTWTYAQYAENYGEDNYVGVIIGASIVGYDDPNMCAIDTDNEIDSIPTVSAGGWFNIDTHVKDGC